MKTETIAIHAGNYKDETTDAVVQPLVMSTTFERSEDGSYPKGHIYSRASNPNRAALENVLAKLEQGIAAADRGAFATDAEVSNAFSKWGVKS